MASQFTFPPFCNYNFYYQSSVRPTAPPTLWSRTKWPVKRFRPLEFFVSVINNGGGYYARQTYLNECRSLGFDILPPDVNKSRLLYTAEAGALRIGLGQLKDLRRVFMEKILTERETGGPYESFLDFLKRTSPGLPELRVLIRSGSLYSISSGLSRAQLFWALFRLEKGKGLFLCPPIPGCIGDYPQNLKEKIFPCLNCGSDTGCPNKLIDIQEGRNIQAESIHADSLDGLVTQISVLANLK